ncbi:iron chelate uptake ABC transporter family permease subunit [Vibrio sp. SCSIO 43136]|uniref:iron chelate uptake ABC transporter family permease subunit n=1 Tax=Vibrio sp. SCSIO 43136 TaxID=2819101 RepID=UPI002075D33E|nr:iron chelate uptake ABC transporter family permease subunit [Vibrio sp. SCSIO 43136]USD67089.1 iron chelate uptake ABC transporter family permease subunit [Vibrio sp. SCSIO 43136]
MRDGLKITLLAIASIAIISWFVGQGLTAENYQFFLSRRLPKVLAIVLAATSISMSSLVFQTITNNRILTPSILGFDSLYLMTQVLLVVIFGSASFWVVDTLSNFLLSTLVVVGFSLLLFRFYFRGGNNNIFTLLLVGIVCGSLFSSVSNFLIMLIDPNEFAVIQNSMFASFNNIKSELVYWSLFPLTVCLSVIFCLASRLDVLWLGRDNATSLGINVERLTKQLLVVITIMVAISTALVGPVLFFGLITVSLTRELINSYHHKKLMLASSLLAIFLLVTGQWFIEKVMRFDTTISVVINLVGGTYFIYLLIRNRIQ